MATTKSGNEDRGNGQSAEPAADLPDAASQDAEKVGSAPLKWHGGKQPLARRILALMPPHLHYVEPFAGGLAVLLARDPDDPRLWVGDTGSTRGVSEVVNDLNGRLINFWRVLQREETFDRFRRIVEAIPMARPEWEDAHEHEYGKDPVEDAVAFLVDARQSLAGRMNCFTGMTRTRTRRGMNGNVSEWLSAVDGLAAVHSRLRRVVVENLPAIDVIRREDTPLTVVYADPPYVPETRTARKVYGEFEMTVDDHKELLDVLRGVKGRVLLSGYRNPLYDETLVGWRREEFDVANSSASGKEKRRMTECVWCNFPPLTPDRPATKSRGRQAPDVGSATSDVA